MGDYQVSEKIRERFDTLIGMEEVQKALKFIENDVPHSIEEQKALTLIEAPTFFEDERAAAYAEHLKALGLEEVHVDEYKNAVGLLRGTGNGPTIMIEAHLDTVFPKGSVKEVREENIENDKKDNSLNYSNNCSGTVRGIFPVHAVD